MILRPSKIFVSFHQLRHYFQTRLSELVVSSHQQPSSTVTQFANFPATQQSVIFFSDMQRSLIQKAYYFQQPVKRNPINEKLLLKVIQRHFPIVKVFSQPTLHGRTILWGNALPSQQLRTMMSSSGGTGGGTTLMTWGFPRTAMVGVGRSNGFGATRQFSTAKSPTCVTFFQNTAPQQPNVFAHISSRIFSPVGNKINQPPSGDEKPKFAPFYSLESDMSSDEESICSADYHSNRMFSQKKNKGMGELINSCQQTEIEKRLYVRREAANVRHHDNKRISKKSDHIIRHDDISSLHSEEVVCSHKNKRKLSSADIACRRGRTKHPPPPDQRHHVKKKTVNQDNQRNSAASVYMLITLDSTPFMSTWSTQSLNSSFIDCVETIAQNYQMRIQHVVNLLERLRFSGKKFRIVVRHAELRIYFPASTLVQSEAEAIEFLKRLQVDEKEDYFSIVVEKEQVDYFSYNHYRHEDTTVGPDYFKDLQMFLDRTDYLIQTSSSAFSNSR